MLTRKIALYIPSTVKGNHPAPPELIAKWVRTVKIKMADLFGGFTAYQAQGGWWSPELGLIEEAITVVQAYTDEIGLAKVSQIESLAQQIALEMDQEVVSLEVHGILQFIGK